MKKKNDDKESLSFYLVLQAKTVSESFFVHLLVGGGLS